jgi:hypothetical protein
MGITLVTIPFWWDKSANGLAASIRRKRPDIVFQGVSAHNSTIPSELPSTYQKRFQYIPNKSKALSDQIDPAGW